MILYCKVLTVANNRYFIGNFDGITFTAIDETVIANIIIITFIMDMTITITWLRLS